MATIVKISCDKFDSQRKSIRRGLANLEMLATICKGRQREEVTRDKIFIISFWKTARMYWRNHFQKFIIVDIWRDAVLQILNSGRVMSIENIFHIS